MAQSKTTQDTKHSLEPKRKKQETTHEDEPKPKKKDTKYVCKALTDEFLTQLTTEYLNSWSPAKKTDLMIFNVPELAKSARPSMDLQIRKWSHNCTREDLQKWFLIHHQGLTSNQKENNDQTSNAKNEDEEDEKEQEFENAISDYMDDFGGSLYDMAFFKHYPLFSNIFDYASRFMKPRSLSNLDKEDDTDWSADEDNCIFAWKLIQYAFELKTE
jgi:hypothetical protein